MNDLFCLAPLSKPWEEIPQIKEELPAQMCEPRNNEGYEHILMGSPELLDVEPNMHKYEDNYPLLEDADFGMDFSGENLFGSMI